MSKYIENREQLEELYPARNKAEEIIDFLHEYGSTPEPIFRQLFPNYFTRCSEVNRMLNPAQIVHDKKTDRISIKRSIRINTSKYYGVAYPNSNGKREKGGDYSAPKSFFRIK